MAPNGAPVGPWYHWTHDGVDFITLDNASRDEFSDAQLRWLRGVLDRDLAPSSGIRTIVAGMHEALPHSSGAEHAMDDWDGGVRTGELVYTWFNDCAGGGQACLSLCQPLALLLSKHLRHRLTGGSERSRLYPVGLSARRVRAATRCPRLRMQERKRISTGSCGVQFIPTGLSTSLYTN